MLSSLTSGPLVIQRQVKALRHLDSFGPNDSYASIFLRCVICPLGPIMVLSCFIPSSGKNMDPAVLVNIQYLFAMVPVSIPCVWVYWLLKAWSGFRVIP